MPDSHGRGKFSLGKHDGWRYYARFVIRFIIGYTVQKE